MSRDDSGTFIPAYTKVGIIKKIPFASIDQTGVGQLMKIAVEKGRSTRSDIKLGIGGEHGGYRRRSSSASSDPAREREEVVRGRRGNRMRWRWSSRDRRDGSKGYGCASPTCDGFIRWRRKTAR